MALKKQNEAAAAVEETAEAESEVLDTEAESVLEEETPQVQSASTEVATSQGKPPATSGGRNEAVDKLAASGFTGLEIDWTSFPTIVLDNGEFGTSDGQSLDTKEITVRLMQSRKRYVLRTNAADDDDAELAYTYDLSELDDADSELSQKVTKWKQEDGLDYTVKEYIEALAIVMDDSSSLNQQMALLQVPPTSTGRFSGYTTSNLLIKGLEPTAYLTRCFAGQKVVKAKKPFVPWAFEFAGEL